MRISDWSSDVCSSDLCSWICSPGSKTPEEANWARQRLRPKKILKILVDPWLKLRLPGGPSASRWQLDQLSRIAAIQRKGGVFDSGNTGAPSSNERISRSIRCAKTGSFLRLRSEEHTSELQSLMRISYAG